MLRLRRFQLEVASCCSEVRTVKVEDPCAYSVYAYVFDDGHTYVGLTLNPETRHSGHKCNPDSAVHRYWKSSGQDHFPDMTVLRDNLTAEEAQGLEGLLADAVDPALRLNTAPVGVGVGALGTPDLSEKRMGKMRTRRIWKTRTGLRTRFAACEKARLPEFRDATPELCRSVVADLLKRAAERARLYREILAQSRDGKPVSETLAWCRSKVLAEQAE